MVKQRRGRVAACLLLAGALLAPLVAAAQPKLPPAPVQELGYRTSWDHFQALRAKAEGGTRKTFAQLPDWGGLWERDGPSFGFDPSVPMNTTTAPLTAAYQAKYKQKLAEADAGREWDPMSYCLPSGFPRMLATPFFKEFVLRPEEVWWITEQQSEVRRIYTDGRGHVPEDDSYPLWNGDSIGFWDGDTLVVHTVSLRPGQYQRVQPDYSDKISTVEQIRLIAPGRIQDRITVYDPEGLTRPWTTEPTFHKTMVSPDIRINMWACAENNNIVRAADGRTTMVLPGEPGYVDPGKLDKR